MSPEFLVPPHEVRGCTRCSGSSRPDPGPHTKQPLPGHTLASPPFFFLRIVGRARLFVWCAPVIWLRANLDHDGRRCLSRTFIRSATRISLAWQTWLRGSVVASHGEYPRVWLCGAQLERLKPYSPSARVSLRITASCDERLVTVFGMTNAPWKFPSRLPFKRRFFLVLTATTIATCTAVISGVGGGNCHGPQHDSAGCFALHMHETGVLAPSGAARLGQGGARQKQL